MLGSPNPNKKAAYFGLIFRELPTYWEIETRTLQLVPYIKMIKDLQYDNGLYAPPERFELPTNSLEPKCSIH